MKIIVDSKVFVKKEFDDEQELESLINSHHETIFNKDIVYIPQKIIQTSGGYGTVPEAIVIDFSSKCWYIVEVELAEHGLWSHIASQVSKQIVAIENKDTKQKIKRTTLDLIEKKEALKRKLIEDGMPELRLYEVVERILEDKPKIVIPIDSEPSDFRTWITTLGYEVISLIVEKYMNIEDGRIAYMIRGTPSFAPPEKKDEGREDMEKIAPISEEAFLKKCDTPGRILFQRLKQLAAEKKHEWKARPQAFCYYVVTGKGRFCPLTLWPNGLVILKNFMEPRKEVPREALDRFREEIIKVSDLESKYDRLKQPAISTREGDLTDNEIDLFIKAFNNLLDAINA
ncbi:MAG: hypothetical protein QXJ17_03990 [Nitrososphaeria archaeon]